MAEYADGFNEILPWFADFDIKAALKVCDLDYEMVVRVCREFASRRSHIHDDLGILMNRHSALVSYLIVVLLALCGRIGVPGGNYLGGGGSRSAPRDPRAWRTLLTDIPAINGMFPPNVLQEEILNDHPEHLRAVLCSATNPLRSYADTTAYEKAFAKLDLVVVVDVAMSETAVLADYVLPCKTTFESWDGHPGQGLSKNYARMKSPVVEAEGEQKENAEIFTLLADAMGLIPEIPESAYDRPGDTGWGKVQLGSFTSAERVLEQYGVLLDAGFFPIIEKTDTGSYRLMIRWLKFDDLPAYTLWLGDIGIVDILVMSEDPKE